jgi:hypothetical protein
MQGLKVQCPNCKRKDFVTTDKYDPDKTPNGSMVKCLLGYHIDWLCSSGTVASEMTCPECLSPLARNGRLHVITPDDFVITGLFSLYIPVVDMSIGVGDVISIPSDIDKNEAKFVCDICGKECKSQFGLTGHKNRSHKAVQN